MKLGFIGTGNMATAIIKGALNAEAISSQDIWAYDIDGKKAAACAQTFGIGLAASAEELAKNTDIILLAVKPFNFAELLGKLKDVLAKNNPLIISIAAGTSIDYITSLLGYNAKVVRVMPNINATIGEAMSAYCPNAGVSAEQEEFVAKLCASFGKAIKLSENYFPAFGVLAGCSPAYAYMFIDELARAGVKIGMNKQQALEIATQSVLGSAKMIAESDAHPYELIDRVCSPGGTTIEGVAALREYGFDTAITKAVENAYNKDAKLK